MVVVEVSLLVGRVYFEVSSETLSIVIWRGSEKIIVFLVLLGSLDISMLLGTSKEGVALFSLVINEVVIICINLSLLLEMIMELLQLLVVMILLLALLLLLVLLLTMLAALVMPVGSWDEDGDLNFLNHMDGMGDLLFHNLLNRIRHLYFFYLHHWVRSAKSENSEAIAKYYIHWFTLEPRFLLQRGTEPSSRQSFRPEQDTAVAHGPAWFEIICSY